MFRYIIKKLFFFMVNSVDYRISKSFRGVQKLPGAITLMQHTTDWGSVYSAVGAALILASKKRWKDALKLLVSAGCAWELGMFMKKGFDRKRPYELGHTERYIRKPSGSSMPSGHAITSATLATVSAKEGSRDMAFVFGSLSAWVGISRIVLGVHHFGDVLFGWIIGHLFGMVFHKATSFTD